MKIQTVTGVALLVLLFVSALMESKHWNATVDRFFFDDHARDGGDRKVVSDFENGITSAENAMALLFAKTDDATKRDLHNKLRENQNF